MHEIKVCPFSFQSHIIIGGVVELALIFPCILLVIGAAKRIRCLMMPFLIVFGMIQLILMISVLACVIYLPLTAKPLAFAVTAFEAFVVFPWWYAVIHLFAAFDKGHFYQSSYFVHHPSPSPTAVLHPSQVFKEPYSSGSNSHTRSMLI